MVIAGWSKPGQTRGGPPGTPTNYLFFASDRCIANLRYLLHFVDTPNGSVYPSDRCIRSVYRDFVVFVGFCRYTDGVPILVSEGGVPLMRAVWAANTRRETAYAEEDDHPMVTQRTHESHEHSMMHR